MENLQAGESRPSAQGGNYKRTAEKAAVCDAAKANNVCPTKAGLQGPASQRLTIWRNTASAARRAVLG